MNPQGNILSILVFFIWIAVAMWGARRWPPAKTAAILLLIPALFLPERMEFKPPGLPTFTKDQIAVFWLFVGVLLFHRNRLKGLRLSWPLWITLLLTLGGSVMTVLLNTDPISNGSVQIPGHRPYDVVHFLVSAALDYVLPFILAAAMFTTPKDMRVLFRILVGAALVYSVLQLVEIRLSPQLHRWVYGYHHSYFAQARRGEGFRPMVFMEHGLAVAMFSVLGVLAAATLFKLKVKIGRVNAAWVTGYLWMVLALSHSLAALLYSIIALPLVIFFKPRTQLVAAAVLAVIVLSYPTVRSSGLVPVEQILDTVAEKFGEERQQSLMTRFTNEEKLLERANERAVFGWGTYCRPCVFDVWEGTQTSIRDGDWIIVLGGFGLVGFFGKYLLLAIPILLAMRQRKHILGVSNVRLLAATALMVGFSAFDLLPNGNFNYLVFMLAGALYGGTNGMVQASTRIRAERRKAAARQPMAPQLPTRSAPQRA